jgi:hypothetical protein
MVSSLSNYIQVAFAAPVVIILAFLIHLMPIGAEESGEAEFNFVAAGDWGCDHEAIQTFFMMKICNRSCILDWVIIHTRTL